MLYVGNVLPPADSGFTNAEIIAGTLQSDGDSCGVHAVMNLRAAAEHDGPWEHLQLCGKASAQSDTLWRKILSQECLQGYIESYRVVADNVSDMTRSAVDDG